MSSDAGRPRWWLLYLVLLLAIFLFWLIAHDGLPDWANAWFAGAVILFVCSLVDAWLVIYGRSWWREPFHHLGSAPMCEHPAPGATDAHAMREPDDVRGRVIGRFYGEYGEMPVLAHGKAMQIPRATPERNE